MKILFLTLICILMTYGADAYARSGAPAGAVQCSYTPNYDADNNYVGCTLEPKGKKNKGKDMSFKPSVISEKGCDGTTKPCPGAWYEATGVKP